MIKKLLLFVDFLFCQKINKPKSYKVFGLLQFLFLLFFVETGNAQLIANYTFATSNGTYSNISSTSGVLTAYSNNGIGWDNSSTANIDLGFTFTFNGIDYTQCSINTNGFLTFSSSTPQPTYSSNTEYTPISSAAAYSGAISALGRDLANNGTTSSTITYNTIGASPNRTFVVQWNNVRRYDSNTNRYLTTGNYNFQIRLVESTNVIQIVYGVCDISDTDLPVQVGLRGKTNSDFNNRTVAGTSANNWPNSTAGSFNNSTCLTGTTNNRRPISSSTDTNGLTYTWTPPTYCNFNSFSTVRQITNVKLNTLDKSSTGATSYENFTAFNTTLVRGQYYTVSIKGATPSNSNIYYMAYIDWNRDGDFTDTGENYKIGTIYNSNGADGKNASVYFQIPTSASLGITRLRIIGQSADYDTNPCSTSVTSPQGQVEDYTIIVNDGCAATPITSSPTTLTTSSTVCPGSPFTLSLGTTFADGATYLWESSANINGPWTNATPAPILFFDSNSFNTVPANTAVSGSASITNGKLILTTIEGNEVRGGFIVDKSPANNINAFTTSFDYYASDGDGADGFSLSYASGLVNSIGGGENGEGSGIIVQFDTYDNDGVTAGTRIRILYNNSAIFTSAINAPFNIRTDINPSIVRDVVLTVDNKGFLSLSIKNSLGQPITVVSNLQLPAAYLTEDKSSWKFKFSGRVGAINDNQNIDNLQIRYLDVANSRPTFTTTQTVKKYYRAQITCGGTVASIPVMVDVISATISPMTITVCSASQFTATPTTGTNGTIPSGTTYTWTAPTVTGNISAGVASTGTPTGNITGTHTNTTATAQTATYTVTPTTSGCVGVPFNLTVTVDPATVPGTITPNSPQVCTGTNSTTLTLSGQTGTVVGWESSTNNFTNVTSITNTTTALTVTDLTATTSYRAIVKSGSCTQATSAVATITVSPATVPGTIAPNSPQVCTGTNSTTLTLSGHTGTIVGWESSTNNFTNVTSITNTTTTLPVTNLTVTTSYRAIVKSGSCTQATSAVATIT
ncbi:GEVED domain-containing protein, partial [Flavobacterium sp. Fl-318]